MEKQKTQVLQWARRVRDFLGEYVITSDLAELPTLRKELDDVLEQLTVNAAAQEAVTKQSRVQTTEIHRLRTALRDGHIKPIVRMSRTMKLEINGTGITFTLPRFKVNNERLAAAGDALVTALNVVGPQFVAKGFAPNFVEQLSKATKALRDAIDQRAAQVSRRIGTTAALERDGVHLQQLVGVIDTLVRPVIQGNQELLATWENVVAFPQSPKSVAVVVTTPAVSATTAAPHTVSAETGQHAVA